MTRQAAADRERDRSIALAVQHIRNGDKRRALGVLLLSLAMQAQMLGLSE